MAGEKEPFADVAEEIISHCGDKMRHFIRKRLRSPWATINEVELLICVESVVANAIRGEDDDISWALKMPGLMPDHLRHPRTQHLIGRKAVDLYIARRA